MHIFNNIKHYYKVKIFYGTFLYRRLIFIAVNCLGDALFSPLYTKLLGSNLPVGLISSLTLIGVSAGLFVPLFKKVPWIVLLLGLYISDLCSITCYILYFIIDTNYLYISLLFHIISCIVGSISMSIYAIRQSNIISKVFKDDYEEYLNSMQFFNTVSVLLGSGLAVLLSNLGGSSIICIIGSILVIICMLLYTNLYKDLVEMSKNIK